MYENCTMGNERNDFSYHVEDMVLHFDDNNIRHSPIIKSVEV